MRGDGGEGGRVTEGEGGGEGRRGQERGGKRLGERNRGEAGTGGGRVDEKER